jgi:predicted dehydrogenase
MPLTIGYIGFGNINRVHAKSAQQLGFDLVAAADIKPAALDEAKKQFNVTKTYDDHKGLVADPNVTAIVVGTPNKFHAEHAIAALRAGKHVFLEKPMALNAAEADAIIAARDASGGKIVQMGMVNRFKNSVQALKHFLDAGRCGDIYSAQTWWYRRRGIPGFGGWFTTKSISGGGALIDIGVHMLDLAVYLMGFPKPVAVSGATYNLFRKLDEYAYTSMWGNPTPGGLKDVDDYALAVIRFDKGQTLQLNISWALHIEQLEPESGLRLMGNKGGVALRGLDSPLVVAEEAGHVIDITPMYSPNDPFLDEMRHFADCIEQGKKPTASAEQGRTVQAILDAIYRSGEQGREVKVG